MRLEHISPGFIKVENEREEKQLLGIFDEFCISLLTPFLCAHLHVFVIAGPCEHMMPSSGLHVDKKIVQVVEEERSLELAHLGKEVKMWDLQVADL
jgi:hypothetical protein